MADVNYIYKRHSIILTVAWLTVHLLQFQYYGLRNLIDSTIYSSAADFLIEHGRIDTRAHVFYSVPIALMAISKYLFSNQILPFIIFQCVLSWFAALALYKSGQRIFQSKLAGLACGLLYLLWLDNIQWNTVALTESLAASFICFIVFYLTRCTGSLKDYLRITLLAIALFFTRSTGIIIVTGIVVYLLKFNWPYFQRKPAIKFSLIIGLSVSGLICADTMLTHLDLLGQTRKGNIITYMDYLKGTDLYYESLQIQPDHNCAYDEGTPSVLKVAHFIYHNPWYIVKTGTLKTWYLLSYFRPYYSNFHNTYSLIWLTFIYSFFYFGLKQAGMSSVIFFVIPVIIINCMVVGISTVDWDNRFYIPMEPGIILMCGGGIDDVIRKLGFKI